MPSAEIITIGTELLLGEIVDTNAPFIAQSLRNAGIDLFRETTVGDNVGRIAQAIREALARCDVVITTGGLGPTVDDPTREAVADAVGAELVFKPELWEQIQARFARLGRFPTDNNKQQAFIPSGAMAIENPVGTAPIFIEEYQSHFIISLPGVPSEMKYLMQHEIIPFLTRQYDLHGMIKTRILHTVGVGESQIDDLIGDLEKLSNPTVGLAAHSGQVDVRITSKAESEDACAKLIEPVERILHDRIGEWVYGVDQETLEEIALRSVSAHSWALTAVEAGLGGYILRRLASARGPFRAGQLLASPATSDELFAMVNAFRQSHRTEVGLGVSIQPSSEAIEVNIVLITPLDTQQLHRRYGGPSENAPLWAFNQGLDLIRRIPYDPKY